MTAIDKWKIEHNLAIFSHIDVKFGTVINKRNPQDDHAPRGEPLQSYS